MAAMTSLHAEKCCHLVGDRRQNVNGDAVCVKMQISATVREVLMQDRRQRNDDDINYVRRLHCHKHYLQAQAISVL